MSTTKSNSNGNNRHSSSHKPVVPLNSLAVKVKYNNTLPDIPFDPKFLVSPLNISRFVKYEPTTLEQETKHELITPSDMGVDIDLILPERYAHIENAKLDPNDEKLLEDDEPFNTTPGKKSIRDKPHSQLHNKVVPWLKKTEYISTEYNRYGASAEKTETRVGYNVSKNWSKNNDRLMDKETQIKAINKTFEAAQMPVENHPKKDGVYAANVLPLLPDFDLWKYVFNQIIFDSEPAEEAKDDQMAQAIIRGAVDEDTKEEIAAYFLPTEITMSERLLDQDKDIEGKEYEYKARREYNWNVRQSEDDFYFFTFRGDQVFYNKIDTLLRLNKRRSKTTSINTNTTLIVKHRLIDEEEIKLQNKRLEQLEEEKVIQRADILTAETLEDSYEDANKASQETGKPVEQASSVDDNEDNDVREDNDEDSNDDSSSTTTTSDSESVSSDDDDDDDDDE